MNLPKDFSEFIELLNAHQVRYLIVGGYAVGFHSRPKFTHDLDIWIENTQENALKVLVVLKDFGFGELDITINDLINPDTIIQLGYAPLRIDLITDLSGLNFSESYQKKIEGSYLGVTAYFIALDDLIINKQIAGRDKDLNDIKWIEQYPSKEK
jgi:hypothetical protein